MEHVPLSPTEQELRTLRLRHAALAAVSFHMKSYLNCMELDYFGNRTNQEKLMCKEMRASIARINEVLAVYYNREAELIDG